MLAFSRVIIQNTIKAHVLSFGSLMRQRQITEFGGSRVTFLFLSVVDGVQGRSNNSRIINRFR